VARIGVNSVVMEETQFKHDQPRGASTPLFSPGPPAASDRSPRPKAAGESGYAMLLVFLLAAVIALALYNELPRVAFQAQRAKEQLLIERGEQYKRAIQLFVRKVGRYPATIEELESLNNIRFLRKRYLDPMTGQQKWRLIHINGGVLTDSIIPKNKPGPDQQQQANTNTFIGEGPVMGAANDPNRQQTNPAVRRRASDDRPVVTQEAPDPPAPDADQENPTTENGANGNTSDTTGAPGASGTAANTPGTPSQQTPGTPPGRSQQPGMGPGQPGSNPAMANPQYGMPGALPNQNSGQAGNGGLANNAGQSGGQSSGSSVYAAPSLGQSSSPIGGQQSGSSVYVAPSLGQSPSPDTDFPAGVTGLPGHGDVLGGRDARNQRLAQQSAAGFGQSALGDGSSGGPTSQNPNGGFGGSDLGPSGPSDMQPPGGLPGMGGTPVGGGIAGVASESTGPAIKVYNERKKYNEWEFVYDQSKDRGLAGVQRNGGALGTPAQSMGSMPGQQPGIGGTAGPSAFLGQAGTQQPQAQPQQPPN
jgi:type II secretory pathway pseudopilin PulG